jgi:cobalt/nickel transport system ATP-binding protein
MIIVSHDMDFLERLATRAVVIAEGRLRPASLHRHVHTHDHIHVHTLSGEA